MNLVVNLGSSPSLKGHSAPSDLAAAPAEGAVRDYWASTSASQSEIFCRSWRLKYAESIRIVVGSCPRDSARKLPRNGLFSLVAGRDDNFKKMGSGRMRDVGCCYFSG